MKIVRNILAVVVGLVVGNIINMQLVNLGISVFPLEGVDPNNIEGTLADAMPNARFEHFVFPFLAHALGTLSGALVAALIAATHKMKFAYSIGFLFLVGGVVINFMIPGPIWFTAVDIALAYIPMAWIGGIIGLSINKN